MGNFADSLASLGTAPAAGGDAFISPDLCHRPVDQERLHHHDGGGPSPARRLCNAGDDGRHYAATAEPTTPGSTGTRYFHINGSGAIYFDHAPIAATQTGAPATGTSSSKHALDGSRRGGARPGASPFVDGSLAAHLTLVGSAPVRLGAPAAP